VGGLEYVQGSALLLAREAIHATGGFDERFFMYCEDADICYRLRQAGWSVLFTAGSEFVHVGNASAGQYVQDMFLELMRAHVLLLAKHRGTATGERARRFVVIGMRVRAMTHTGVNRRRYTAARVELAKDNQIGPTFAQ
jgi:GT2 family glycosyltransferase